MTHDRFRTPIQINVDFERRDDGGLRVYSDDVPGFVLSHANCEAVIKDIAPALEGILSAMLGYQVIAGPMPNLGEVLKELDLNELTHLAPESHPRRTFFAIHA